MIEILGPILAALLGAGLFKKHPYCLWFRRDPADKWVNSNPAGNSARRCRKARTALQAYGWTLDNLMILPKGIIPPAIGG